MLLILGSSFSGGRRSDTACLCSHPSFSDATRSCASSSCGIEDRSSVNGVLNNMCSATRTFILPSTFAFPHNVSPLHHISFDFRLGCIFNSIFPIRSILARRNPPIKFIPRVHWDRLQQRAILNQFFQCTCRYRLLCGQLCKPVEQ